MTRSPQSNARQRARRWLPALPLALIVVPLFDHTSPHPILGGYSSAYLGLLGACSAAAIATAWWNAIRSVEAGNAIPARKATVTLGAVMALLAVLEIGLRFSPANDVARRHSPTRHGSGALPAMDAPHARLRPPQTDAAGLRLRPLGAIDWSEPRHRIFVVGSSSAFGILLGDEQTWPHLLEANLRAADLDIEVWNASRPDASATEMWLRIERDLLPLEPRWLVVDPAPAHLLGPPPASEPTRLDKPMTTRMAALAARYSDANAYLRTLVVYHAHTRWRSRFRGRDWYAQSRRRAASDVSATGAVRAASVAYLSRIEALLDLSRSQGRNESLANDPGPATGTEIVLLTLLFDASRFRGPLGQALALHNDAVRRLASRRKIVLIDLAREFEPVEHPRQYFFEDAIHPSALGAEWIASELGERFAPMARRAR